MRIVMVAPQIGDAFGQERVISRTSELLGEDGHEVYFIADSFADNLPPHREKLAVPGLSSLHTLSSLARIQGARQAVQNFLQRIKPDVVHLHDCVDFRLLQDMGKRYATLLTAHTLAPTCPSSARLTSNFSPCTQTSGWGCIHHNRKYQCLAFLKTDLHRAHAVHSFLLRRKALRRYLRSILAVSRYVERTLIADGWPADQVRLVPNPVDTDGKVVPEALPSPAFVYAARLTPLKGLEVLLRALATLQDREWTLWILGEGSDRTALEKKTAEAGLGNRVRFLGKKSPGETRGWMAGATALIAPNLGPETFGLSVAEACALGTPVISADLPALNEILVQEKTGLLFPAGDAAALARCLVRVLEAPVAAREWARNAQAVVRERYSARQHYTATLQAYEAAMIPRDLKNTVVRSAPAMARD